MTQIIAVTIETALVDAQTLSPIVAAIQVQVDRDFAPAWGVNADLMLVSAGNPLPSGAWRVRLMDRSDQEGDLGYHQDDTGTPESRIFVADVERFAASLSVTISHEILEMLADPLTRRTFPIAGGKSAACEVCDPVEDDNLGYPIDGVQVSDFVLPAYFDPASTPPQFGPGSVKYDFRSHLTAGCPTLTAGGYQLEYDPAVGAWSTLQADVAPSAYRGQLVGRCAWRSRPLAAA